MIEPIRTIKQTDEEGGLIETRAFGGLTCGSPVCMMSVTSHATEFQVPTTPFRHALVIAVFFLSFTAVAFASAADGGTPASLDPVDQAARLADILQQVGQTQMSSSFAGITLESGSRVVDVHTTDTSPPVVGAYRAAAAGSSISLLFSEAQQTEADIYGLQALVNNDRGKWQSSGIDIAETVPEIGANSLGIGIVDGSQSQIAAVANAYIASRVSVYSVSSVTVGERKFLLDRTTDVKPWNAGDVITSYNGSGNRAGCTSGFGVRLQGGGEGILSAGHCTDGAISGWKFSNTDHNGGSGVYMGPVSRNNYNANQSGDDRPLDVLLIDANASGLGWVGNGSGLHTNPVVDEGGNYEGEQVCESGSFGGEKCQLKVVYVHGCYIEQDPFTGENKYECAQSRATGDTAISGDSGAPVYRKDSNNNLIAVGILSAGSSNNVFFTGMDSILDFLPGSICTSSACP